MAELLDQFRNLTAERDLSAGTAVRHFNVMHHMMEKAATIWSKETGIDRNPADQVEVKRPNDERNRYLSKEELGRLMKVLERKAVPEGNKGDQPDVSSAAAACLDRPDDRNADQ
jgi:hypothetical protein